MSTGILWQIDRADERLDPTEQVRRAAAACVARHGRRPAVIQVHPGAWPEAIDGARIVPTARMSYPTVMLLVLEEESA